MGDETGNSTIGESNTVTAVDTAELKKYEEMQWEWSEKDEVFCWGQNKPTRTYEFTI